MRGVLLASLLLVSSGVSCTRRFQVGEDATFAPGVWMIVVIAVVSVAACIGGAFLRRKLKWVGALLLAGGVLVLCTTVPGLALSRVTVGPNHFEWRKGTHHYRIGFDELDEVSHTSQSVPIGRGRQRVHYLDFKEKNGNVFHIQIEPTTDQFVLEAIPELLRRARQRHVTVIDPPAE